MFDSPVAHGKTYTRVYTHQCIILRMYMYIPGPALVLPVVVVATSAGRELAPSMPSCTLLDTLPTLVLCSKLLFLESRGESCTPCSEYSSDLNR